MSSRWIIHPPAAWGERCGSAVLKQEPGDFFVAEWPAPEGLPNDQSLSFPEFSGDSAEPSGQGDHLCLYLQKSGDNTEWVGKQVGKMAGLTAPDVGYCGLKDRNAITRQWFSFHLPGKSVEDNDLISNVNERWTVLAAARRPRKLRRGEHGGNVFRIRLHEVTGDRDMIEQRLEQVRDQGCPNYFGPQRFGINGQNLDEAAKMGEIRGRLSRLQGLYYSAARSYFFNQVLSARLKNDCWNRLMDGDPEEVPTGPLWGDGGPGSTGELEALEREVAAAEPELLLPFSRTRMPPERRPLVLKPLDMSWSWQDDCLEVVFRLSSGQYATTVLAEVLNVQEPGRGR